MPPTQLRLHSRRNYMNPEVVTDLREERSEADRLSADIAAVEAAIADVDRIRTAAVASLEGIDVQLRALHARRVHLCVELGAVVQ